MREAQEIERLRAAQPSRPAVHFREPAELDEPGLVRMQGQVELAEPFPRRLQEAFRVPLALEPNDHMVGTPTAGEGKGDRLVGDAALNHDMVAGGLDVVFSGIANIDRGTAHATPTVQFQDVPVAADGTFARGQGGHRVQGGFCGPGHAEAAGIFEQSNIVGAFGAKRR